jgi:hypothetical protein
MYSNPFACKPFHAFDFSELRGDHVRGPVRADEQLGQGFGERTLRVGPHESGVPQAARPHDTGLFSTADLALNGRHRGADPSRQLGQRPRRSPYLEEA